MQVAVTTQGITKRETGKSALGYSVRRPSIWEREYTLDGKQHGLKIVQVGELDTSTAQSPGKTRAAAVTSSSPAWQGRRENFRMRRSRFERSGSEDPCSWSQGPGQIGFDTAEHQQ